MVSPQALLGLAVGMLLILIGGYALHLAHRIEALEEGDEGSRSSPETFNKGTS